MQLGHPAAPTMATPAQQPSRAAVLRRDAPLSSQSTIAPAIEDDEAMGLIPAAARQPLLALCGMSQVSTDDVRIALETINNAGQYATERLIRTAFHQVDHPKSVASAMGIALVQYIVDNRLQASAINVLSRAVWQKRLRAANSSSVNRLSAMRGLRAGFGDDAEQLFSDAGVFAGIREAVQSRAIGACARVP